jgi:hypothetical protein
LWLFLKKGSRIVSTRNQNGESRKRSAQMSADGMTDRHHEPL